MTLADIIMIVWMNYKYCKGYVILVDPTIHYQVSTVQ